MPTTWTDRGLLVLRFALGLVFIMHGWQKVMTGHDGVTGFLTQLGVPFPALSAAILIAVELGGGIALIVGALTRVVAALIAFDMVVAIALVHVSAGFFLPNGYEYALALLLASLALTMTGPGAYSVDRLFTRTRWSPAAVSDHAPRRAA
jgi:putative oxidoreductase